jgi:hypothetical protein
LMMESAPVIKVAERSGGGFNGAERPTEDRVVVLPDAVVLLDGATSLRPELPTGGWYASKLADELADRLRADPPGNLADLLADAIAALVTKHGLTPGSSPSSTVAMLRWRSDTVDALVLADSPVIVFTERGHQVVADDRLAAIPRVRGGYRARLRTGGGYNEGHVDALRSSARSFDQLRNRPGGFWVAEADPAAAYQACQASWPRADVLAAILASDGVSCGVDDYAVFADWAAVLELARARGPEAVLDTVRAAERTDPDGAKWPRPKPYDDQAMALVEFTE